MNDNLAQAIAAFLTMTDEQLEARRKLREIINRQSLEFDLELEDADELASSRNRRDRKAWEKIRRGG